MATFYYNRHSNESHESQWIRYLQNQAYFKDANNSVAKVTEQQTIGINETIKGASKEQVLAIQESTNVVCGTLNSGFEMLSENLQEISYGIDELRSEVNEMASMLDWNLSLIIEQQRITNLLLGNIAVLLRIPDIQKERQYHIEQGIKFLKNAIFDNDFYDDALKNLLKAETIEPSDYFVLYRIGLIYMYSTKHLDLKKAEEYFKKTVKYSIAESNIGASVTKNYLAEDITKNLSKTEPTIDSIKLQTAEAYLLAGRSCYIQGKFSEAAECANKAFSLVPQMVEAGFIQAKALAANNNEIQAAKVLDSVISTDRFYSLKALSDLDLCTKQSVKLLLKKFREEATEKAISILQDCKKNIIQGSNATDYLDQIERLINKNTYLTSKKAIDLLEKVKDWKFCEPFKNPNQIHYLNKLVSIVNSFNQLEYYKKDDKFIPKDAEFIDVIIKKTNEDAQWIFPLYSTISVNPDWHNQIQSKAGNFNVVKFIELEKKLNDYLPIVIKGLEELFQQCFDNNTQELKILIARKIKDDKANYIQSIFKGLLGSFGGILAGAFIGSIIGMFTLTIISKVITGDGGNIEKFGANELYLFITAIAIIGAIIVYNNTETSEKFSFF